GDDPAHRRVAPTELLHRDAVRDVVAPAAAVLIPDRHPENPHVGELSHYRVVDLLGPVPLRGIWHDLAIDEISRHTLECRLLIGEGEVHQCSASKLALLVFVSVTVAAPARHVKTIPSVHPSRR